MYDDEWDDDDDDFDDDDDDDDEEDDEDENGTEQTMASRARIQTATESQTMRKPRKI